MSLGAVLFERARYVNFRIRQRWATAVAAAKNRAQTSHAQSKRRRDWAGADYQLFLEALEQRQLLSGAIGTIPDVIDPGLATQIIYAPSANLQTIPAQAAGPDVYFFKFAIDSEASTNEVNLNLLPAVLASGSDAGIALYDESGNLLASSDQDLAPGELGAESLMAEIATDTPHIIGVFFGPAGPPVDYRLAVSTGPQLLNTPIAIDPGTGMAHLDANTGEDTFNTPRDVDFYELDLFNGGPGGTVTVTPTGLDVKVFAALFRRNTPQDRWEMIDSGLDAGGGAVALTLMPPAGQNLTDGQYMLGVAPLEYNSAARSYEIDVATTSQLVPGDVSGLPIAQNFMTPLPDILGVAEAMHPDSLVAGSDLIYQFRAPFGTTGQVIVSLNAVGFDPVVSVYNEAGTELLDLASLTSDGTATLTLDGVDPSEGFRVRVGDGGNDEGGSFTLTIQTPYTPIEQALNPLVGGSSVTTVNNVLIGGTRGARIFRIQPAFGVDVLALGLEAAGGTAMKIALRGTNLPLMVLDVAAGQDLFLPVDIAGKPGPIDVYVAGLGGPDTATLKIGQVDVPNEVELDDLATKKLDLAGDLNSSYAGGAFGARQGQKHYQTVTELGETTVVFGDGLKGAVPPVGRPILAQYRQGTATKGQLVGYALPTETDAAMIEKELAPDSVHGFLVIAMNFEGTDSLSININGPDEQFVGVGMVPDPPPPLPEQPEPPDFDPPPPPPPPPGPFFSVLRIRDIIFEHDFERHLWKTILPANMISTAANPAPRVTFAANLSPNLRADVKVFDESMTLLASGTNAPGGTLTLLLNSVPLANLQGETIFFQIDPQAGGLLDDGLYTLEMSVETSNPFPFLTLETAWRFFGTSPSILMKDQGVVRTLPQAETIRDIIQNQFGDGSFTSSFTSSLPFDSGAFGNPGSIDVFRFWVETPGPVTIRTVDIDPDVNTSIKVYQPRFNSDGTVRYLGQIENVELSMDWFPADRSETDSQTYVNDFDVISFISSNPADLSRKDYPYRVGVGAGNTDSGGFYYVVVKNEQGTTGQYKIEVDAPDMPLLGNIPSGTPSFQNARQLGTTSYAADLTTGIQFTESITDFVGYYPIQIPDFHGANLTITPSFFSDWEFDVFDSNGQLLTETNTIETSPPFRTLSHFSLASGSQTVFLRVEEENVIANSLASLDVAISPALIPIGTTAPPTSLPAGSRRMLPTDPLGNGLITNAPAFVDAGQSRQFSFQAAAGQIRVRVGANAPNDMRLRWGVYVDGQRIGWDHTSLSSSFDGAQGNTMMTITLPKHRPPLSDSPDYFHDLAPLHDVVVYMASVDAPAGTGQFTVAVETDATEYPLPKRLAMDVKDLFAETTLTNVDGNDWVRLDVPEDLVGLVDLDVHLKPSGIFASGQSIRVDVYDLEGNLLTSRTESSTAINPYDHTFNNLEGTLPGNSYYLRVSHRFDVTIPMDITAHALLPKASPANGMGKPPAQRQLFGAAGNARLHRMVLTPEEGVGNIVFGDLWDANNPNVVFASVFWVNEAGVADLFGRIDDTIPSTHDSYVALYRGYWTAEPEFPYTSTNYKLELVDYTNGTNVRSQSGNNFYDIQANLEPGMYVLIGESNIASQGGQTFINLADYDAPDMVIDPNFGTSLLPRYMGTSNSQTSDGYGNRFEPTFDQVMPGFRTSYYEVITPPGSQAGMIGAAVNLPTDGQGSDNLNREARVHAWYRNPSGFFIRDGDPETGDPLNINAVDPPTHPLGELTTDIEAKPNQTFYLGVHRDRLDTKIGAGVQFIVPISGDPDLVTETPLLSPNDGKTRVDVTVRNNGFAPALFWDRRFQYTDTSKNPDHTTTSDKLELPIGPLGARSFVFDWVPVMPEDFVEYFADFEEEIDEIDETNNHGIEFLFNYDPHRPTVSMALEDGQMDGVAAGNVWGRYINGVLGASTNVIITANDTDGDLFEVVGRHPFLQGAISQDGAFYFADVSGASDTANINFVDFGKFFPTSPENPNKFKMRAKDEWGLLSDETVVTARVEQFPGWLDNDESSLEFNPESHRYEIKFRNALVDWGPHTVSELAGFSVPFIGGLENQVLAEIKAETTAGLNPDVVVEAPVTGRVLVRILGEDILNETWTGTAPITDHFYISTDLQINKDTLATDWLEIGFKLVDYPLFNWESPEIKLFAYGVPGVASINAYLQFFVNAVLNAGITIAIDPDLLSNPFQVPEILGLTTPTFVAPTITPGIEIGGEIEILGFDIASISGSLSFGITPALGLPSTVADQLIPFQDFFSVACLGLTGELTGEIAAEVLGFEVFSFDLPSAEFNFNPDCTVVMEAPLPSSAPHVHDHSHDEEIPQVAGDVGTVTALGGDEPIGTLVIDPVPNIVIDPVTGGALYVQAVDVDGGSNTKNNLVFSQRTGGVWSALANLAGATQPNRHMSNPALALTHDGTGTTGVVVYQAINHVGAVETLARNDFLKGQDIRYRYYNGTTWGSEQSLITDSRYDADHAVAFNNNGKGIAAWVHNKSATPLALSTDSTPGAMDRASNEIYVASWNPATHSFGAPTILTADGVADGKPAVYIDETGTQYVVWTRDTVPGSNTLMFATNSGSGWSAPAVLPINGFTDGKFINVALGSEAPGRIDVLFSHVTENPDLSVTSNLYNRPTTIAGFALPAAAETLAEDANFAHLRTVQGPDGLVAYWQQGDGVTNEVFASQFDAMTSTWSRPVQLSNTEIEYTPSLAIDTDGTFQLVYELQTGGGSPSPAPAPLPMQAPPVGMPTVGNVASSSTSILPEVGFSRPLNFPFAGKLPAGTTFESDAQIVNRGVIGDDVLVEFITGDINAPTLVESQTVFLDAGARLNLRHVFAIEPGDVDYSIRLTPLGGAEMLGDEDNISTTSIFGGVDLSVVEVTVSDPMPAEGQTVDLTATIRNNSNIPISTPFKVKLYNGDPAFAHILTTELASQTIPSLGAFAETQVTIPWTVPAGGGHILLSARVDATEVIEETTEFNNDGQVLVVVRPDAAVLGPVTAEELNYSGVDNVEVTATIVNRGKATLTNLRVALLSSYDDLLVSEDDPSVMFEQDDVIVIPSLAPGATTQVVLIGDGFAGLNNYRVVVDPGMEHYDSNWSNNVEDTSLILQGLPDLQVEIDALVPTPPGPGLPKPIQGDPLTIRTTLSNTGILPARDFKVEVFALNGTLGSLKVGSVVVDKLDPISQIPLDIPIDTSKLLGITELRVIVDRLDKVLEINENNNTDFIRVDFQRPHRVVGRHVFYAGSPFVTIGPAGAPNNDTAIAPDKEPLFPGRPAEFKNYTSYSRGLNGVIIDIENPGTMSLADFQFRVGNSNDLRTWTTAPAPTSIRIRPRQGINESTRVEIAWADNAIQKQWLQVVVLATPGTALPAADVFYFGNAIGETGNSTANAIVNATDEIGARNHPAFLPPATIDNIYDFNRDKVVNATDQIIVRNNNTFLDALRLITAPGAAGGAGGAPAPDTPAEGTSIGPQQLITRAATPVNGQDTQATAALSALAESAQKASRPLVPFTGVNRLSDLLRNGLGWISGRLSKDGELPKLSDKDLI